MKKIIVLLTVLVGFSFLYACGSGETESTQETPVVVNWDGEWAFSILGEPSEDFDEFKLFINGEKIDVIQGNILLWSGTFNTEVPPEGEFTIVSTRDPAAKLIYTPTDVKTRQFHFKNGTLTYSEGADGELEFIKAK